MASSSVLLTVIIVLIWQFARYISCTRGFTVDDSSDAKKKIICLNMLEPLAENSWQYITAQLKRRQQSTQCIEMTDRARERERAGFRCANANVVSVRQKDVEKVQTTHTHRHTEERTTRMHRKGGERHSKQMTQLDE